MIRIVKKPVALHFVSTEMNAWRHD